MMMVLTVMVMMVMVMLMLINNNNNHNFICLEYNITNMFTHVVVMVMIDTTM